MGSTRMSTKSKPREFEMLECRTVQCPDQWLLLTYCAERRFFEPVTNCGAGDVIEWRYAE